MALDTLDETKPLDTDPVSFGDDEIRLTRSATKQSFGLEHWLSGEHKFIVGSPAARPAAGKAGRLFVNNSNNTIEYDNGAAWISTGAVIVPGSIGTNEISNGSVTNLKLADNSVSGSKIIDGTITAGDIADGTITAAKLQPGAISGSYIADKSIWGDTKIQDNSIWGARQIADGSIPGTKIQDYSITAVDLFPGACSQAAIAINATVMWINQTSLVAGMGATTTAAQIGSIQPAANGRYVKIEVSGGLAVGVSVLNTLVAFAIRRNGVDIAFWYLPCGATAFIEFPLSLCLSMWDLSKPAASPVYTLHSWTSTNTANVHTATANPGFMVASVWA